MSLPPLSLPGERESGVIAVPPRRQRRPRKESAGGTRVIVPAGCTRLRSMPMRPTGWSRDCAASPSRFCRSCRLASRTTCGSFIPRIERAGRTGSAGDLGADRGSANGRHMHAGVSARLDHRQRALRVGGPGGRLRRAARDRQPSARAARSTLTRVLARHTCAPGACYFAVWEGWGGLPPEIRSAPTFSGSQSHLSPTHRVDSSGR